MNYNMPYMPQYVAQASPEVRSDFIRRVYGFFFLSLVVSVLAGSFVSQPSMLPIATAMTLPFIIGEFICLIGLYFARRVQGLNMLMFFGFAAFSGALIGPLLVYANAVAPGIPAQAAILTVAAFGGLTMYAIQSRKDFNYLGGFLMVALIALIVAGFVMFFIHSSFMSMVYSVVGVLIFSGYVLYDTSNIMLRLRPDETLIGAISLYLDFINLFLMILNLLMQLQRRD